MLIKRMTEAIGRTPLLEVDPEIHGLRNISLFAKLECLNPWGSVKDRTAWWMLKDHMSAIQANGQMGIESSSGNTASAMGFIFSMHGVRFRVVTSRIQAVEMRRRLQLLGIEVSEFPGMSPCPDVTDPHNPIQYIEHQMRDHPGEMFHPSQYTNPDNSRAHYETTGPEIHHSVSRIDFFIGGLGTCGSTAGAGQFLKEKNPNLKVIGVTAKKGHLLPGIRNIDELKEVGLFQRDFYADIVGVSTDEAIDGMLTLLRKLGVPSGPTGGAAYAAAIQYLARIDGSLRGKHNAVFIAPDRVDPYLTTWLPKHRPQLFDLPARRESVRSVTDEEAAVAPQVMVEAASRWLDTAQHALVVDLRGVLAFKAGHLPGSINFPADQLADLSESAVPFSHENRVLFVCPDGNHLTPMSSRKFAAFFKERNIDCASLAGGFTTWRDAGMPTERSSPKPRQPVTTT